MVDLGCPRRTVQSFTVIIPTLKREILTCRSVPSGCRVLIQQERPTAKARNEGARKVRSGLLIFLDDDLVVSPALFAISMAPGEFGMVKYSKYPCSRALIIRKEDYERVGGFNESLIGSEDLDFYIRAADLGLSFREISKNLIQHREHGDSRRYRYRYLVDDFGVAFHYVFKHPDILKDLVWNLAVQHFWQKGVRAQRGG
jgi:glycosyltransferase involved in cell wall biosynthesis